MSNDFSTIVNDESIEKINLVRVQTAREIGASLSLSSGTTYTNTFHNISVHKITVDGSEYSLVSGTPSSSEYSFSESTKLITINLGTSYSSQQVVVFYYLFYSKEQTRLAPETPTDSSSTVRSWIPRIASSPNTTVDSKDIQTGKLKFGSSALRLHNQDHDFEQYLTDKDSFANKEIVFWVALNDVENVEIAFKGVITRLTIDQHVVIDFDDTLALLDQTFFSNGSYLSSTFNTTKFPNMNRTDENKPIRKLYSEITKYKTFTDPSTGYQFLTQSDMLSAVSTNFSEIVSVTNNRELGTILAEGDHGVQSDTVQAVTSSSPNWSLVTYTAGKKYKLGDSIIINGNIYGFIIEMLESTNQFRTQYSASIATSQTISRSPITLAVLADATHYKPLFGRDYTMY